MTGTNTNPFPSSPCTSGVSYHQLVKLHSSVSSTRPSPRCLHPQEVRGNIDRLQPQVEASREEMVSAARPLEAQRIQETASLLKTNWDKLNRLYQDRLK